MKRILALLICALLLLPEAAGAGERLYYETGSLLPLKKGDSGALIENVQCRLIELGFAYGLPDGEYGSRTEDAVKWAQRNLNKMDGYKFAVDGAVDEALYRVLASDAFPVQPGSLRIGSSGDEVTRLQRRLVLLGYMNAATGTYSKLTADAVSRFQARNGLAVDGVAGPETKRAMYDAGAVGVDSPEHPLLVYVDIAGQLVYVYQWAGNGFTHLIKTMPCSTGKRGNDTIRGIFATTEHCGEWYWFAAYQVWAKYAIRIRGPYLFHSTLYSRKNDGSAQQSSIRALGQNVSHGCIRLATDDIKWLYENTKTGFTTIIY